MPSFQYKAFDASGNPVSGSMNAPDEATARNRIREQGFFPTELFEGKPSVASTIRFGGGVSDRQLAAMTRLLATLLQAGFSVVDALETLARQSAHPELGRVLQEVQIRVQEGGRLSDGMEAHPGIFPHLYVQMVRAGESGAALEAVLSEIADYLEVRSRVRDKFKAALAYPAIMTLVGTVMLGFLVAWVVPTMAEMLESGGKKLPFITTVLIFVGDLLLGWWWVTPFLAFGFVMAFRMALATEGGRSAWDTLMLRLPVFGDLFTKMSMARFSRLLAVLLGAGVPVLRSLEIVQSVMDNVHLSEALEAARVDVARGANIADSLRTSGLFPPLVVDMIAAGQRSGKLKETLYRLSSGYDSEVESSIELLMALLEPALILIMAVAVSFVVAGVLLPIFEMTNLRGF